jgi:hypothetical protein
MIKHEFDNIHQLHIDDAKQILIDHFPAFTMKDYTINDVWVIKKGLHKHEIKIYPEKIFIKSMIDANSPMISFPIMLFFIIAFILNQWIFKKQGMDLIIPLFIVVLSSFALVPAAINLLSTSFKNKLDLQHKNLVELFQ